MHTDQLNRSQEPATVEEALVRSRRRLGDVLLEEGLITEPKLREALRMQRGLERHRPLGQLLVDQKIITQQQLNVVLLKYQKKYLIGDLLVESNVITEDQHQVALQHQKYTRTRLGDVLLHLKFITEEQLKRALCEQHNVTFVDLDKAAIAIDPGVLTLVSRGYAQRHRVIPVAKTDNRLTLAIDDPTNATVVEELRSSTGCSIELITSTRAAFDRALSRAYDATPGAGTSRAQEEAPQPDPPTPSKQSADAPELVQSPATAESIPCGPETNTSEPGDAVTPSNGNDLVLAELKAAYETMSRENEATGQELRRLRQEHESAIQGLAQLHATHEALRQEYDTTTTTLRELGQRHEALLHDRRCAAEGIAEILNRLKPVPWETLQR